jgi:hypothetical protein
LQVHIPKCAGTAISDWMRQAAVAGVTSGFAALYPPGLLDAETLWASGLADPRLTTMSAHNVRLFPETIHGRRMHYFTILRRPRAQSLSALRYILQEREGAGVPARVGPNVRDILAWLYEDSQHLNFENAQTNHLALYAWCETAPPRCRPLTYADWRADDVAAFQRERLPIAKQILHSFLGVAIVERLAESMEVVRRRSAAVGIDLLPVTRIRRVNVTDAAIDRDEACLGMRFIGYRFLDSFADDEALYAYGELLLDFALAFPPAA